MKYITDMIQGILIIKLYGWERPFMERITILRKKEMKFLKSASFIRALNEAIFFASSSIIAAVGFIIFWKMGGELTASTVFTTSTYIQIVRLTMTNLFAKGFQLKAETITAINRIENLLSIPVRSKTSFRTHTYQNINQGSIGFPFNNHSNDLVIMTLRNF
jgi:ATP-binding cassette subfamily C (CFTR/MRP) protein 4